MNRRQVAADGRRWKGDEILMVQLLPNRVSIAIISAGLALGPVPAPAVTLAALTDRDELGYTCIPEVLLETAYRAEGKGVMLPRTCLPEPCERQIAPEELAMLMGRRPNVVEWGDYVSRYADHCVAETRGAWRALDVADIRDVSYGDDETLAFWAPVVFPAQILTVQTSAGSTTRGGAGSPAAGPPPFVMSPPLIDSGRPPEASIKPTPGPENPAESDLPVVPLPPALWLLVGALGLGGLVRRFI